MKSTVYVTEGNNVQNLQQLIHNGFETIRTEFPRESGNHCSDMQRLVLKLKVNTSSINLNLQEAITRIPCFRRSVFIKHLFLVMWCRFTF